MTKPYKREVPGNVLATAAMTERILSKTGLAVHQAAYSLERMEHDGNTIKAIRFMAKGGATGEWLAVITAVGEGGAVVAFHSGEGLTQVIEGTMNRLNNGSLKWKADEYAK